MYRKEISLPTKGIFGGKLAAVRHTVTISLKKENFLSQARQIQKIIPPLWAAICADALALKSLFQLLVFLPELKVPLSPRPKLFNSLIAKGGGGRKRPCVQPLKRWERVGNAWEMSQKFWPFFRKMRIFPQKKCLPSRANSLVGAPFGLNAKVFPLFLHFLHT